MTFSERLMNYGEWRLRLRPDTPLNILGTLDLDRFGFGHIVILPTWQKLNEIGSGYTDADRRAKARYMGVYRSRDSEFEFSGPGLPFWLGDEDGKGDTIASITGGATGSGTFLQWAVSCTPAGFDYDVLPTAPGGTYIKLYERVTRREILNDVVSRFGVEWKMTPDFKFHFGVIDEVFETTPRAAIVRNMGVGHDTHLQAVAGEFDIEQDLEDWTRQVDYYTGTEASPTISTANSGAGAADIPYRNVDGTAIPMTRIIEDFGDTPTSSGATLAAAQFGRFNRIRQQLTAVSTGFDIGDRVSVGDFVWLYDPARNLVNLANEVPYRGGVIWPVKIRCTGMTSPIRKGMGVYFRRWIDNNTTTWDVDWVDLTEWVEWDRESTRVEMGDLPRPVSYRSNVTRDRRDVQAQSRYLNSIIL